jgi:hypothetical protein
MRVPGVFAVCEPLAVKLLSPRKTPMLTDTAFKNLKPKAAPFKVTDREGMYVAVSPDGTVTFRYDYRVNQTPHAGPLCAAPAPGPATVRAVAANRECCGAADQCSLRRDVPRHAPAE